MHINVLDRTRNRKNQQTKTITLVYNESFFKRAILTIIPQKGLCWSLTIWCCGLCTASTCSANATVSTTVAFEEVIFPTILQIESQF